MKDKTEFLELTGEKNRGEDYDVERYVREMERIMSGVFHLVFLRKGVLDPEDEAHFWHFRERCWAMLEDGEDCVMEKLRSRSFLNDRCFFGFVARCMENLLFDYIREITPGLKTRVEQIGRVLKPVCRAREISGRKCWALGKAGDAAERPAGFERVEEAARGLALPEVRYPKPGAKRGSSVKDDEMAEYLTEIVRRAGGLVLKSDIVELVRRKFSIVRPCRVYPVAGRESGDGSDMTEEDLLASLQWRNLPLARVGAEHVSAARRIFDGLSPESRVLFHRLFVFEIDVAEIASEMKVSAGTVYYKRQKLYDELKTGLEGACAGFGPDERKAAVRILRQMIAEEVEANE